ncbi:MAG TPA: hypothetical protein VFH53_10985 [Phycisphaerae bacterium]|nr:hypothetical protein [Phycisphaerae bacterium]
MGFAITKTKWIAAGAAVLILAGGLLLLLPRGYITIEPSPPGNSTRNIIKRLEAGLAVFYGDFGDYPPSDKEHMAAQPYGYQNLVFYLCGPDGTGWGGRAGGSMPFGGTNEKTFGPYFERDGEGSANHPAAGVSDAIKPAMPILYFRAEPTEEPMFDAADNPLDPTGREGFASQEHFEMLARRADGQRNVPPGWVRSDFLLISAGPDRRFGYVVEDKASGGLRPARPEEKEKAFCDDVTNFKH